MKKSLIMLIVLCSILPLCGDRLLKVDKSEESNLSYINKQYDTDESNSDSYVITFENQIVQYGEEIVITLEFVSDDNNNDISIVNSNIIFREEVSPETGNVCFTGTNTYLSGEYSFDIEIGSTEDGTILETIYSYSDGEVACFSASCIEESRELYYCNFVLTEEQVQLLEKEDVIVNSNDEVDENVSAQGISMSNNLENDDNLNQTISYYDTVSSYVEFVDRITDITHIYETESVNLDNDIKVSGKVEWIADEKKSILNPLINNYVYLYINDELVNFDTQHKTNENGEFTFIIDHEDFNTFEPMEIYVKISASNDAAHLTTLWSLNFCLTPKYCNITANTEIYFGVTINSNGKLRTSAFEISQAMYYSRLYIKEMSNVELDQILVIYPNIENRSYFFGYICLARNAYKYWDVCMHEYGHYVDYNFKFTHMPGGNHKFSDDLCIEDRTRGLKLAYSEAIASYIGISAQLYLKLDDTIRNYIGDYAYNSYNGAYHNAADVGYGESSEGGIIGFLLSIADENIDDSDDTSDNKHYDKISIGYQGLWDLLYKSDNLEENKKENFNELLIAIMEEYSEYMDEIGCLLEFQGFAPEIVDYPNIIEFYNTIGNNVFSWRQNNVNSSTASGLNSFSLVFYSEDLSESYKIDSLSLPLSGLGTYKLTSVDLENILSFNDTTIYYQVSGIRSDNPITGPYFTGLKKIQIPPVETIYSGNSYSITFLNGEIKWYKMDINISATYDFSTNLNGLFGEIYLLDDANGFELEKLTNGYSYEGDIINFNSSMELEYNKTIFIKLLRQLDYFGNEYILNVSHSGHNCEYEYTPYGIKYHIQKCHCGNTTGSPTSHTLDPDSITIIDGVPYKRCRFCNALVLSNSGGFIPVQGEKPGIEPLIYRREDLDE